MRQKKGCRLVTCVNALAKFHYLVSVLEKLQLLVLADVRDWFMPDCLRVEGLILFPHSGIICWDFHNILHLHIIHSGSHCLQSISDNKVNWVCKV